MFLSRNEVRDLDRRAIDEYGVPSVVLMENAGRGSAELLLSLGVQGRVAICCGKGNNGGDGFVMARHLDNRQVRVKVFLFGKPADLAGDAAINYRILARAGAPLESMDLEPFDGEKLHHELALAEWIIDALFGTGLTGPVRSPFDQVITAINGRSAKVLAVDIPSGLDCDTGQTLGPTVRADHTATFAAQKTGFASPAAQAWLGQVHVLDIGIPRALLQSVRTASSRLSTPGR
jgi:NAD(P)H-hydrate epimerase